MDFELVNGELKEETVKYLVARESIELESIYNYLQDNMNSKEDITLWRYMDFTKFLSLIDSQKLFFSKPVNFEDPYEGSFSLTDLSETAYPPDFSLWRTGYTLKQLSKRVLDHAAVMCWHRNTYESAAMWNLYLSSTEGIAIKTSRKKLLSSIDAGNWKIFYGEVEYVDYENDKVSDYILPSLFYKRHSFSHENEFRLIVVADPSEGEDNINSRIIHHRDSYHPYITDDDEDEDYEDYEDGSYEELIEGATEFETNYGTTLSCNLKELIEEIYIAPAAPSWFVELVKSILKKYDLESIKVIQSNLNSHNLY